MYFAYVLKSCKNRRYYTGSTSNLEKRFDEHNAGRSRATKNIRPLALVYYERFPTRSDATKREQFLKTGQGREWLRNKLK